MLKIQFPQINRKLTAGLPAQASIWLILFITVLGANLLQSRIFSLTREKKLQQQLLQDPAISSSHEKLGQYYLGVNEKAAEKEYKLAQEYYHPQEVFKGTSVLGDKSSPWQTWTNLLAKKKSRENEQSYWEKITEVYPNYLYAFLKLAVLHFQKGETDKANTFLGKVLQTDPTNQTALKLQQKFQ